MPELNPAADAVLRCLGGRRGSLTVKNLSCLAELPPLAVLDGLEELSTAGYVRTSPLAPHTLYGITSRGLERLAEELWSR